MKQLVFSLILCLSLSTFAQNKEKIKGNREVVKEYKKLEAFNSLKINDDLEVRLLRSDEAALEITADNNLIDVVAALNTNGELILSTTHRISSYKKFKITLFYTDVLTNISLNDEAELHSDVTLKFNELTLANNQESKSFLTVNAEKFKLINNQESQATLNVNATNITLELNDNSKAEALLNASEIEIDMVQRAEAKLEGDAINLFLNIDNSCEFNGTKLTGKNAKLFISNRAEAEIDVTDDLELSASGTSKVSIYGDPKINLTKFSDEAILYKKLKK